MTCSPSENPTRRDNMHSKMLGFVSGFAVALVLTCSVPEVKAQCASGIITTNVTCTSAVCSSTAQATTVIGGPYGVRFICGSVSCCGSFVPSCWMTPTFGTTCSGFGALKDPAIRKNLLEILRKHDVMFATCDGTFHPLTVSYLNQMETGDSSTDLPAHSTSPLINDKGARE